MWSLVNLETSLGVVSVIFWWFYQSDFCSFDALVQITFFDAKVRKGINVVNNPIEPVFISIVTHEIVIAIFNDITISEKLKVEKRTGQIKASVWSVIEFTVNYIKIPEGKDHVGIDCNLD